MQDRFALLVRCDPDKWDWRSEVSEDGTEASVMWRCNLKEGTVPDGTPVWVLGTKGTGFYCAGYTRGDIKETDGGRDNHYKPEYEHLGGAAKRIELRLRMCEKEELVIRGTEYEYLIKRQSTFTWLSEYEADFLEGVVG